MKTNEWETKSLGEVVQLVYGKPLPPNDRKPDGKYPVYGANGEMDRTDRYYWEKPSIIVGRKGSAGEVNLSGPKFWPLDVTYFVKFDDEHHDLRFLYYLLDLLDLQSMARGVKPGINRNDVYARTAKFPPLTEQRRIAGIVDGAITAIVTAKANAEKNARNARSLFESELQAVFTQRGEDWREKRLGDVAEFKNGLNFSRRSAGESVRVVGVSDFGENYQVPLADLESVTIDDQLDETYEIRENDLLTVRSNGSKDLVGRCMLVPAIGETISYSGFVIRIRPDRTFISPRFLLHFMKCSGTRDRLTRDGIGANISSINQGKLSALTVPLPALKVQHEIVTKIDRLKEETLRLESLYQQKLAALDALKKSLLHQAFSGQLTAQAPVSFPMQFVHVPSKPALVRFSGLPPDMLHAGVLAMSFRLHEKRGNLNEFGHVKAEKTAHMVESHLGYELDREPLKEAAGPLDFQKRRWVDGQAKLKKWFEFEQTASGRYEFHPLGKIDFIVGHIEMMLGPKLAELQALLQWMLPMTWQQAEIVATVYAGWNNLLLDGKQPTEEEIVYESRENWHAEKLDIERWRFFKAIEWLREKDVVPSGKGKRVVAKRK